MPTQRQIRVGVIVKILLFPICGIVSLIILANTLSVALQVTNPKTAVWLNPINIDARINLVYEKLRKNDPAEATKLVNIIQKGRKYTPLDAKLISLDGIYNEKIGASKKAQEHFSTSLAILPTEYQALLYKFRYQFKNKQYVKALDIINIVSKRWPKRQNTFLQFIPAIAITSTGFEHASKLFATSKQLRILIITALVQNPATINLAVKLVQNWNDSANKNYWNLGNFITNKLIKSKKFKEANLAFRSFLNKSEQSDYKYIYNGSFAKPFLRNPFDWAIHKQVGVSHNVKQKRFDENSNKKQFYLEIRFLDKPIQYRNVSQLIKLSPGDYNLKIHYFTKRLHTPKPIKVTVSCFQPFKELATYTLDSTDKNSEQSLTAFNVPFNKCDLAKIYFHTDFIAKSWRNRYSGILGIKNISIEQAIK